MNHKLKVGSLILLKEKRFEILGIVVSIFSNFVTIRWLRGKSFYVDNTPITFSKNKMKDFFEHKNWKIIV
jgi:hypothetical protein